LIFHVVISSIVEHSVKDIVTDTRLGKESKLPNWLELEVENWQVEGRGCSESADSESESIPRSGAKVYIGDDLVVGGVDSRR